LKILAAADKSVSNLNNRLARLWPDDDKKDDGINYWKGKPIIPTNIWKKVAGINRIEFGSNALSYFPDGLVEAALLRDYSVNPKEDPFEIWIEEYKLLLKYKKIELPVYDDTHIV
jgi:hypothetical protein